MNTIFTKALLHRLDDKICDDKTDGEEAPSEDKEQPGGVLQRGAQRVHQSPSHLCHQCHQCHHCSSSAGWTGSAVCVIIIKARTEISINLIKIMMASLTSPSNCASFLLASQTRVAGITYWIPAPAKAPVIVTCCYCCFCFCYSWWFSWWFWPECRRPQWQGQWGWGGGWRGGEIWVGGRTGTSWDYRADVRTVVPFMDWSWNLCKVLMMVCWCCHGVRLHPEKTGIPVTIASKLFLHGGICHVTILRRKEQYLWDFQNVISSSWGRWRGWPQRWCWPWRWQQQQQQDLRVMAMMGKLVERVKTGKRLRK